MPLFGGRASMLEVQNRALIKTAKERAQRIEELEQANNKVEREVQQMSREVERLKVEARVLLQADPGVGATQPGAHRGGHQIFFMGPEPRTRTCQDRSRWRTRAPVRSLVRKPGQRQNIIMALSRLIQ